MLKRLRFKCLPQRFPCHESLHDKPIPGWFHLARRILYLHCQDPSSGNFTAKNVTIFDKRNISNIKMHVTS